jgi:hypothetical protein
VAGLPFLHELTPNVIAALAAASATLIAALINLRIAWRREVLDRMNKRTPKARRGLLIAIAILVVAAGVGGYAGALYLMQNDQQATRAMRLELRQRIAEIKEATARLEQTRVGDRASIETQARLQEDRRRGAEGVISTIRLGPCRARGVESAEPTACRESELVPTGLCVAVPAAASVYEVTPYARVEGDAAAWDERRGVLGATIANVRFAGQPVERADGTTGKNVCIDVWSLDNQRAIDTRVLVRYLLPDRAEASGATGAPIQAAATGTATRP